MSSRFHNKFHRHNHHTTGTDPQYPDASHDPIASPESPFQGDFVLNGSLSSAGVVTGDFNFNDSAINPFDEDYQTTGEFIQITVNGVPKYIRLWDKNTPVYNFP